MAHPTYTAMRVRRRESAPPRSSSSRSRSGIGPSSACNGCTMPTKNTNTRRGTTTAATLSTRSSSTSTSSSPASSSPAAVLTRRVTRHVVLRGSQKLSTKNNPHVGSFRHAPPTTFRSMEVSDTVHFVEAAAAAAAAIAALTAMSAAWPPSSSFAVTALPLPNVASSVLSGAAAAAAFSSMAPSSSSSSSSSSFTWSTQCFAMKSSPYVGFMRHAPPTSSSSSLSSPPSHVMPFTTFGTKNDNSTSFKYEAYHHGTINKNNNNNNNRFVVNKKCQGRRDDGAGDGHTRCIKSWVEHFDVAKLGYETDGTTHTPTHCLDLLVDGRLVGGSPGHQRYHTTHRSSGGSSSHVLTDPTKTSSALKLLTKITSWLLYPVYEDDDEDNDDDGDYMGRRRHKAHKNTHGLKVLAGRPYDCDISVESEQQSRQDDSVDHHHHDDDDDPNGDDESQASGTSASSLPASDVYDDQDDGDDGDDSVDRARHNVLPRPSSDFTEMNISVSEVAEAYYAHQLIDETNARRRRQQNREGRDPHDDVGSNQLDYVITQMDIARMARNASRHLDVDSILTLPTVIYRKSSSSTARPRWEGVTADNVASARNHRDGVDQAGRDSSHDMKNEAWSFVMVSGVKSSIFVDDTMKNDDRLEGGSSLSPQMNESATAGCARNTTSVTADEVCVICLEAFRDGDRLRVLPCDHSFHIGCIDRWLSGSHSYHECFTAGCPTCKQRPKSSAPSQACDGVSMSVSTVRATGPYVCKDNHGDNSNDDDDESLTAAAEMESNPMDGSVPSWAFAKLGSSLWQHD